MHRFGLHGLKADVADGICLFASVAAPFEFKP